MTNRLKCLVRGHDWAETIDIIQEGYGEPQFFQCYCKRCEEFKFGIYNKEWIDKNIKNKNGKEI